MRQGVGQEDMLAARLLPTPSPYFTTTAEQQFTTNAESTTIVTKTPEFTWYCYTSANSLEDVVRDLRTTRGGTLIR